MEHGFEMSSDRLIVVAWPHDHEGADHDPRGRYVEKYWLGVLGPTATWLLRHLADELEASPAGFVMSFAETARMMGVGGSGKSSPFVRAVTRLVQFDVAQFREPDLLAVRTRLPSLSRRHVNRLPVAARQRHEYWLHQQRLVSQTRAEPRS